MSGRLFSLLMAFAFSRARRVGGRIWWVVLALSALARFFDRRDKKVGEKSYKVRSGEDLDVSVRRRGSA